MIQSFTSDEGQVFDVCCNLSLDEEDLIKIIGRLAKAVQLGCADEVVDAYVDLSNLLTLECMRL